MTAGIGHNGGPQPADAWARHCWAKARADLLPHLPIEVIRRRVARAQALGLDYKTYAGVRATTGRDVVAFLYSSNALRILPKSPDFPPELAAHLARAAAQHRGLAVLPLTPLALDAATMGLLAQCHPAPRAFASFRETRAALRAATQGLPCEGVILIAEPHEKDWAAAGKLAYALPVQALAANLA